MFYPVVFLIQFILFRGSKYIWKHLEGGKLKTLLSEMNGVIEMTPETKKKIEKTAEYMMTSPITFHSSYSYWYIFCELYNTANIVFQFFLMDSFLNNAFFNFGLDAVAYINSVGSKRSVPDPFTKAFPKMAKCLVPKYGPAGNIVNHEALCVLPWNNVVEKFFLFWWFWLVILGFISVIGLIYRLSVLVFPSTRYTLLRLRTYRKGCDSVQLKRFCMEKRYGDWFVLSLLQKNLDSWMFATLVNELDVLLCEGKDGRKNR